MTSTSPRASVGAAPRAEDGRGALTGRLRERLLPLLLVFGALFAISAPLAFFVMASRELDHRGDALARQAAQTLARYAEEQPVLWRYDSLKLVEHLRYYQAQADVVRIDVLDARDVPIESSAYEPPAEALAWSSAPIEVSGRRLGSVWVGSSRADLRQRALALFAGFTLLAILLGVLVYAIALRNVRIAEERIAGLVERLAARSMEERLRALRLAAIAAQEEDRRAIARDLHDSVAQSLTAIRIQTEVLSAHLDGSSETSRKIVDGIAKGTDATIEEVRRALARLRPAALDEIGLEAAIDRLADDAAEQLGIEIERSVVVPAGLPTTVETTVYRIVQEGLTNAVRHARGASRVTLDVAVRGDVVDVVIEDDGAGFAPRGGHEGRGVLGMRERAELLGGKFEIGRVASGGTRLHAEIPSAP